MSFWLDFITDFHSKHSKEKNRILKREIVSEAVDKWISSGGRFLMKCSGGYRFVILPSEQISLAAHYFRNFRSMGMLRRTNAPRNALPDQVSQSNTMDVSAAASAERWHLSQMLARLCLSQMLPSWYLSRMLRLIRGMPRSLDHHVAATFVV